MHFKDWAVSLEGESPSFHAANQRIFISQKANTTHSNLLQLALFTVIIVINAEHIFIKTFYSSIQIITDATMFGNFKEWRPNHSWSILFNDHTDHLPSCCCKLSILRMIRGWSAIVEGTHTHTHLLLFYHLLHTHKQLPNLIAAVITVE